MLLARDAARRPGGWLGTGGRRSLQNCLGVAKNGVGGFDSHALPPCSRTWPVAIPVAAGAFLCDSLSVARRLQITTLIRCPDALQYRRAARKIGWRLAARAAS